MMASFTYRLPWPPSVNSAWRHTGRVTYLTKPQREFRKEVSVISCQTNGGIRLTRRLAVALELIAPNRRKYDIDGRIKAVLDALQHAGIIADDELIDHLDVQRLHIEPPGACDVTITELGANER